MSSGQISPELVNVTKQTCYYLFSCTCVYTVCLHLEQAFETVFEEIKLETISLKKHLLNLVLFQSKTSGCSHLLVVLCQCKIIEKSVMDESFVFCLMRLDPRLNS